VYGLDLRIRRSSLLLEGQYKQLKKLKAKKKNNLRAAETFPNTTAVTSSVNG
jgi:hypothetical protein